MKKIPKAIYQTADQMEAPDDREGERATQRLFGGEAFDGIAKAEIERLA